MRTHEIDLQKIKFFIYCRKSSDSEDKQIASLPDQEKILSEYANRFGLRIVELYKESKSAFKIGRTYFNEMVQRIEMGEGNAVLAWDSSRIARNSKDSGSFIYLFDEEKLIEFRTPQRIFTNNSDDKMSLGIDFTLTKKSSDDLSKNVRRGNREKFIERKEWGGPAKPGYLNYTNPLTKENTIITDRERFPIIQNALKMIAGGGAPMKIFDLLNNEWGYKTRQTLKHPSRPMSRTTFYGILRDPFYYRLMRRRVEKEIKEETGKHEPMIKEGEFEQIQIRLSGKRTSHYTKKDFPYKQVLICGECQGSITCEEKWQIICPVCKTKFHKGKLTSKCPACNTKLEEMEHPKTLQYVHYRCTKKIHENCTQGSLSVKDLERKIDQELQRFEIPEEFKNWAFEYIHELNLTEEKKDTEVKERLLREYKRMDDQLKSLIRIRISPEYLEYDGDRKKLYEEEELSISNKKADLKKKLEEADVQQQQWIAQTKETFDFVSTARYQFEHGTVQEKTYVLKKLGSNLRVFERKLLIDGDKSYFLVEKGKREMLDTANRLQPGKYADLSVQMLDLEPVCSVLRRGWDSNPR